MATVPVPFDFLDSEPFLFLDGVQFHFLEEVEANYPGGTEAYILFRDKRAFIGHRGPAIIKDRDARAVVLFRDKRAFIAFRDKRVKSGNN